MLNHDAFGAQREIEHVAIFPFMLDAVDQRIAADRQGRRQGEAGVAGADLRYNLTWHDWLNLESLITVSEAICAAALARDDSRGAHFREDFPHTGELAKSAYSRVRLAAGTDAPDVSWKPVRPGQSLLTS